MIDARGQTVGPHAVAIHIQAHLLGSRVVDHKGVMGVVPVLYSCWKTACPAPR